MSAVGIHLAILEPPGRSLLYHALPALAAERGGSLLSLPFTTGQNGS